MDHVWYVMDYEWNPRKAATNYQKHGVRFADAATVLSDPFALTLADASAEEERFIVLGMDAGGHLLVVVYTWRGADRIRLISARPATRSERRQYEP